MQFGAFSTLILSVAKQIKSKHFQANHTKVSSVKTKNLFCYDKTLTLIFHLCWVMLNDLSDDTSGTVCHCQVSDIFAQMECSKWSTTEVTISMTLEKGPEVYSLGPLVTIKNIECNSLSSDFPGIENVTRKTLSLNATVHLTQHFRWEKIKNIKNPYNLTISMVRMAW